VFTAIEICFTALEGFIIAFFFTILSGNKDTIFKVKHRLILFTCFYTIYAYSITYFIPSGIHTLLILLLTIFTLNHLFKSTLFKSIIKSFLILTFIAVIEMFVSVLSLLITNTPLNELLNNNFYVLICSAITKSIEVGCMFIVYKSNLSLSWLNNPNPYLSRYKQILVITSAVVVFWAFTNIYLANDSSKAYIFNIISLVIYITLILFMASAIREGSKLELLQYANEMQRDNIQQLIDFNEMVAKERHEYKNHLNTIFGLCTLNRPDTNERIKHYINNYANNSSTKNIYIDSGNDLIDAIINVKYNNGLRKGIELKANFDEPLPSADVQEDVAVTVFSNIIDNAFDALSNIAEDGKFVLVRTYVENSRYYISISNNGPMIPDADKRKIFSAGYSTKDNPSKTRGFGLCIVQNEINRCNGSIDVKSTPELTEFLISFNLRQIETAV